VRPVLSLGFIGAQAPRFDGCLVSIFIRFFTLSASAQ